MKPWIERATEKLEASLYPLPHELNELDWKQALSPDKRRLAEHLSAFANLEGGGFLVFGVDNSEGNLVGINPPDASRISNQLANLARSAIEPPQALDHAVVDFKETSLLFVHIPESAAKPVQIRGGSVEDSFIRSNGTTRRSSRHELASMMLNSRPPRWEELHASGELAAEDVIARLDVPGVAKLLSRPAPSNSDEILRWLQEEKMVQPSGSGGFCITNFGAIAAARDINQFDSLSRKAVRLIVYKSINKTEAEREIVGKKGYAIGLDGLLQRLGLVLPQSEIINKALRVQHTLYPDAALRELIPNALIHQDFSIPGTSPMIEVFPNRIEITNPGRLLPGKRLDRLIGTTPQSRNEILAAAFRRYGLCEERGTGFQKAVAAIELFGLPPLRFEEGDNWFKVTLFAPRTFAEMAPEERIEVAYQHAVLRHLGGATLTNTTLRERLTLPEKRRDTVSKLIREAVEAKKLKPKDPKNTSSKFSQYLPWWA